MANKSSAKAESVAKAASEGEVHELDLDDMEFNLSVRDEPKILSNRYLMGKQIGKGASAEVMEVLDLHSLERRVVKVFKINRRFSLLQSPEEKVKEVREEHRILRRLSHPNVIRAYELMQQQDEFSVTVAVVTEYCAGSLEELRLTHVGHRLPLAKCHFYFHQLMDGIEYLHSKSIIHGDVKPENLMLVNDNTLKLADFGSYTDMGIFPGNEKKGVSGGSAFFQPPEQLVTNDAAPVDHSIVTRVMLLITADVWSCGIVLFMIACGRHPFLESDDNTTGKLHDAIMKQPFVVTPVIRQNRALDLLFRKILQPDWRKRAGITEIKRDAWYNISISHSDTAGITARKDSDGRDGDRYRSMTMTAALNQLYRPIHAKVKVIGKDMADFDGRKEIPFVRANRSPEQARSPPRTLMQSLRDRAARLRRRF